MINLIEMEVLTSIKQQIMHNDKRNGFILK
jgi:hypothetical protein